MVVDFLRNNKECFGAFQVDDAYLLRMSREGSWGGEPELVALSNMYMRSIEVYMFSPTGTAVHVRTYTPVLGMEAAAPMRFSLLPISGRLEDSPNHYSYLEQVVTVLGAAHVPAAPRPAAAEVDLTCDEDLVHEAPERKYLDATSVELTESEDDKDVDEDYKPGESIKRAWNGVMKKKRCAEEVEAAENLLAVQAVVGAASVGKKKKVNYYKLYEHYFASGLPQACADLAARGEVAWYGCECGECHRAASFGSDVWEKIVCNDAAVKTTCKVWKPWSMYQTVVRPKLGL
jgi:hypothetical protein